MQSIHYVKNVNDFKKIFNTKNHIVTIGVFDGVHKGHQSLISQAIKEGVEQNLKSSLITFQNSPYHHIKNLNDNNSYLNTIEEKTSILKQLELDQIILIEFNDSINQTSAIEFLKILKTNIKMKRLIVGPDFAFGKDRIGDIKFLTQNQNSFDYELSVVDTYKKNSEIVSSTKIKKLILSGEIDSANSYLGKPYNIQGKIISGKGRGKKLNMPTANLDYNSKKIIPKDGIYSCKVEFREKLYLGALSIGNNPTFGSNNKTVEVHLIDFKDSIYGESINIKIYKHMRDQIQYNNIDSLMDQMQCDLVNIREYFKNE